MSTARATLFSTDFLDFTRNHGGAYCICNSRCSALLHMQQCEFQMPQSDSISIRRLDCDAPIPSLVERTLE
ncbi:hypothetical protein IY145_11530 [Methylosinus sp. H3A]|uniref:hypothetical protein n=1 Tax=Methylosinus sp. H3A TaxID=2785786 RepID=UPI0018C2B316|nr:hypothetical protein [Methylosinus sp. H3A]MBG0810010.1 hypothetical protein [Methylosinus sp. H3A]